MPILLEVCLERGLHLCSRNTFNAGQSIPNRSEVRHKEGVKIYFDPVSTAAREESARELAARVLASPSEKDCITTVRIGIPQTLVSLL